MGRSSENLVFVEKEWEGEKEIAFRYILTRIRFISTTPQLFTWPRLKSLRPSLEHRTVIALSLGVLPGLLVPLHFFNAPGRRRLRRKKPHKTTKLSFTRSSVPQSCCGLLLKIFLACLLVCRVRERAIPNLADEYNSTI